MSHSIIAIIKTKSHTYFVKPDSSYSRQPNSPEERKAFKLKPSGCAVLTVSQYRAGIIFDTFSEALHGTTDPKWRG